MITNKHTIEIEQFNQQTGQAFDNPVVAPTITSSGQSKPPGSGVETIFTGLIQYFKDSASWEGQITEALAQLVRTTEKASEKSGETTTQLEHLESLIGRQTTACNAVQAACVRLESSLAKAVSIGAAQAHNLEQIRIQGDSLSRSFEKLSHDVIEREVIDPVLTEFTLLYEKILVLVASTQSERMELQYLLQHITDFLGGYGVQIIHPLEGERFDPRKHQPVMQLPTHEKAKHGSIAGTLNAGLAREHRVVKPARVEIFSFSSLESANCSSR